MRQKLILIFSLCFVCTGCTTFEAFLPKEKPALAIAKVAPEVKPEGMVTGKAWVPAKTRKVWVNSHIDEDGNMIDGHYKYIVLEEGHWALQEIAPDATHKVKQNAIEKELNNE